MTDGAEIVAHVAFGLPLPGDNATLPGPPRFVFQPAGVGVGVVTRPGLCLPVGEPAINPVPETMVSEAVMEALAGGQAAEHCAPARIEVTIGVTGGDSLAQDAQWQARHRGRQSILGTTGIVKPLSADAWTATIAASMSVGRAMGATEVVLSTGRRSEAAHMDRFRLPEECYVMMGDYVEYALGEARRCGFDRVQLCCQWGKMLKVAMATPQTHVRHGAID